MSGRCLECILKVSGWWVSQGCLEGVWRGLKVYKSVWTLWRMIGWCMKGVCMSVGYLESVLRVSGRCLEGLGAKSPLEMARVTDLLTY